MEQPFNPMMLPLTKPDLELELNYSQKKTIVMKVTQIDYINFFESDEITHKKYTNAAWKINY